MLTIQIDFDELLKVVEQLSHEQKRILQQRMTSSLEVPQPTKTLKKRVAGLGDGTIWMSDDFIDPLPDEFWFGEDG
jgi:hypothetical protein